MAKNLTTVTECTLPLLALALAACALKPVSRAIIRWRAAKLPKGPDAERAQEELEGILEDSNAAERAELAIQVFARPSALNREIAERAAEEAATRATEPSPTQNYPPVATHLAFTFGTPQTDAAANTSAQASVSVSVDIKGMSVVTHAGDIAAVCVDNVVLDLADLRDYEVRPATEEELRRHASEPAPLDD
jgi:hypothetical protein